MSSLQYLFAFGAMLAASLSLNTIWVVILAFPFQCAWNAVIPSVFKLPQIDYWESFAILALWVIFHSVGEGVKLSANFRNER
jgi:hypothetical protein